MPTAPLTQDNLRALMTRLVADGEKDLTAILKARGFGVEIALACAEYRRALDAIQHAILTNLPGDVSAVGEMATAYLAGRIALVASQAEQNAQSRVTQARADARAHWLAAIAAEKRRQLQRRG